MNLLLLFEDDRVVDDEFVVTGARADHLRRVIGVEAGRQLKVGLLNESLGNAEVLEVGESVRLRCGWQTETPPRPHINLLLAMPRPKTLKKVLLEASAWGIDQITITQTERVEKAFFGATLLKPQNYEPVLHEGLMQGRHVYEPTITVQRSLRRWLAETDRSHQRCLALHPETDDDVGQLRLSSERLWVAVGPEGGFIEPEVDRLREAGFEVVHIGRSILRVETAVVSALAQLDLLRRQNSSSN